MEVPTTPASRDRGRWQRTGGRERRRRGSQRAAGPTLDIDPRTRVALGGTTCSWHPLHVGVWNRSSGAITLDEFQEAKFPAYISLPLLCNHHLEAPQSVFDGCELSEEAPTVDTTERGR